MIQENRSFDNLFHDFEGADTATLGYAHDGTPVKLQPVPFEAGYDLDNSVAAFRRSYDGGKMDGYDLRGAIPRKGSGIPLRLSQYPAYAFVSPKEVAPYINMARRYVLADRMFQTNVDQSFAAHLYLIAGQAGRSADVPNGRPWGCDAYWRTSVPLLNTERLVGGYAYPCFDFTTLGDEVTEAGLTWSYYAPAVTSAREWAHAPSNGEEHLSDPGHPNFGGNWSAYDAIAHVRFSHSWKENIKSPPKKFLNDVRAGLLANVTWVIPDWKNSDHALSKSNTGPSWVASVVNAVGRSRFWRSTAIFIVWDDSGGWYDHVPPPQVDYDGLGVRVPLLVVSAYAKHGFVSHAQHEFGSILKFAETMFALKPMADSDGRADNLLDCFDFGQPPEAFRDVPAPIAPSFFESQPQSRQLPDKE